MMEKNKTEVGKDEVVNLDSIASKTDIPKTEVKNDELTLKDEESDNSSAEVKLNEKHEIDVTPQLSYDSLLKKMDDLSISFEQKIKYDQHKETTIDRLHTELKAHKENLVMQLLRPILTDVIITIEHHKKWVEGLNKRQEDGPLEAEKLLKGISELPDEWFEILNRQGVSIYECEVGSAFDGKSQKPIKSIETNDETRHRTIARKIKPGYEWSGIILQQELVEVFNKNQ